jgi:SAM-dependent methyltransferase
MARSCPLCNNSIAISPLKGPLNRHYFHCPVCDLIFVSSDDLLTVDGEKERYEKHENDINDAGYVNFLNQAIDPALPFINTGMRGLDFGSGPGPALSTLLGKMGFDCQDYDPVFGPSFPEGLFDFIFSTEAFEHFHDPVKEMNLIHDRLNPGGFLVIMTMWHSGPEKFLNWFYARDDTHVLFFSFRSFEYIARRWGFEIVWDDGKRVIILQKKKRNE